MSSPAGAHPVHAEGGDHSRRPQRAGALLVTNHASLTSLADPSPLFAAFDVYVNDKAGNLFEGGDDD
jgi:hypothetical protein